MENTPTKSPAKKRDPVHVIKHGDTVTSVFRELKTNNKTGKPFRSYSVSCQRSWYDEKTDSRKYTAALFDADLLDAAQALTRAYYFIEGDRREKIVAEDAEDKALEAVA